MLDVLIALALVALGYFAGRKRLPTRAEVPPVEERELCRLREDRAAFSQLMGYSPEQAYGLHQEWKE